MHVYIFACVIDCNGIDIMHSICTGTVRPEKFQFLEKRQNRNFDYKIVISVKNPKFIL